MLGRPRPPVAIDVTPLRGEPAQPSALPGRQYEKYFEDYRVIIDR